MKDKEQCVTCAHAKWRRKKKNGEPNTVSGGLCTLELNLPNCYIDPSRPGDRCWPWKRPVTKFTRPGCKYYTWGGKPDGTP